MENPGGVCDRQIFNVGSPYNEVSIRQLAETMREIYAADFRVPEIPLSEIVTVSGEDFYGKGYDDSDRRIPNITKARTLLGWEPQWPFRDLLKATMSYYVHEYPRSQPLANSASTTRPLADARCSDPSRDRKGAVARDSRNFLCPEF